MYHAPPFAFDLFETDLSAPEVEQALRSLTCGAERFEGWVKSDRFRLSRRENESPAPPIILGRIEPNGHRTKIRLSFFMQPAVLLLAGPGLAAAAAFGIHFGTPAAFLWPSGAILSTLLRFDGEVTRSLKLLKRHLQALP